MQRQFKTPDEWLGESGVKFRRQVGYRRPEFAKGFLRDWGRFFAKHDGQSLADVEALMDAAAAEARKQEQWP